MAVNRSQLVQSCTQSMAAASHYPIPTKASSTRAAKSILTVYVILLRWMQGFKVILLILVVVL